MVNDTSVLSLPISSLPSRGRELLSYSLNSEKIILSDGVPRDWRGLAFLVNVQARFEPHIKQCEDKTSKVLEIWKQNDRSPSLGDLIRHLERMDRYDVAEDLYNYVRLALSSGEIISAGSPQHRLATSSTHLSTAPATDQITDDDRPGYIQIYDAMVLYAEEDAEFAMTLMQRLRDRCYQLCTQEQLQAGHMTQYAPMTRLISERCRRVVLILSPDFLASPAMQFYSQYAAAISIETDTRKILPILYRPCNLKGPLNVCHKLRYQEKRTNLFDFWEKLYSDLGETSVSIAQTELRAIEPCPPLPLLPAPQITITEYPSTKELNDLMDSQKFNPQKLLISTSPESTSLTSLDSKLIDKNGLSRSSTSLVENGAVEKKKKNYISSSINFLRTIPRKITKKVAKVAE